MEKTRLLRKLGSTNLVLSPLGLGCWQFSNGQGVVGKFWLVLSADDVPKIVIPGASKIHHAQENVKAMQFKLTTTEIHTIGEISNNVMR
ncbi:aryl-alcohol dehydrogenase-like predicted oxidoreductase [Paenibacillus sp. V4I3]|uniref:aldo/keto reductase n=1 Tax=unclassified Paenibacillus TaxID=185978 RepID=UPI00278477B8|nr:aryl-alcohol dehydrogenase-like predicted oxidoreductase [Paenibacillus sp. V4I3]MDQ0885558.1 aryl-alcohol dehydrogenase-like predicted oxidoreductase [Paenibacillus sp. V4I9]